MRNPQENILATIRKLQSSREGRVEARELCYKELSESPHLDRVKLALAKLFYLDGYYEFALDILLTLRTRVSSPLLGTLISHLGGSDTAQDKVLAQMSVRTKE